MNTKINNRHTEKKDYVRKKRLASRVRNSEEGVLLNRNTRMRWNSSSVPHIRVSRKLARKVKYASKGGLIKSPVRPHPVPKEENVNGGKK